MGEILAEGMQTLILIILFYRIYQLNAKVHLHQIFFDELMNKIIHSQKVHNVEEDNK
jgi:hypothetical protein